MAIPMKSTISPDRSALLPGILLAYTLFIAYVSLTPFTGWRVPASDVMHFLTVWPRYITRHDVFINILAYIPFGLLAALILRRQRNNGSNATAMLIVIATVAGAALSLGMETLQAFIPGRVAELTDLLTNTTGSLIGAILVRPCWRLCYRKD